MRRTTLLAPLLGTVLCLSACVGFDDFLANTTGYGTNPHLPMGDSLTMRRVQGQTAEVAPIAPQQGNVWPRGVDRMPTLQDIEGERGSQPRSSGNPRVGQFGSSAPPQPPLASTSIVPTIPSAPAPSPLAAAPAPSAPIIPTATGPAVVTTGTDRYQTVSTPTGTAVVVPNGNGTATLMRADGTMETVPAPR